MTQADDDAATAGGPPTGAQAPGPAPAQPGGQPGQFPPYYGPPQYGPPQYGPPQYRPPPHGPVPQYGPPPHGPAPQYGWRPAPVPLSPDGRPLADFGTRLLAYLIDAALLTGIAMIIFVPVLAVYFFQSMPDLSEYAEPYGSPDPAVGDFVVTVLLIELGLLVFLLAAYYVYYVEMMFRSGQTVGKKLMKLKVIPLQPGATLTRGMAAKRYLVEFPGALFVPFFSYLDGLWQLWDKPYQQTLHDKFAKTVVIKVAP